MRKQYHNLKNIKTKTYKLIRNIYETYTKEAWETYYNIARSFENLKTKFEKVTLDIKFIKIYKRGLFQLLLMCVYQLNNKTPN